MDVGLALESFRYDNDEGWFEMMVKCTEFVSVNSMYGINSARKVIFASEGLTRLQNELKDQIVLADPKKHCPWISTQQVYYIHFNYILNHGFWTRDLDNMLKAVQDIIFECLGVNDSRVIEHHNYKNFRAADYEYLIFRVGISLHPYNQFNI